MNVQDIKSGLSVRTKGKLRSTDGMITSDALLSARHSASRGVVLGWLPGHGGDVWVIEHPHGKAVYSHDEFEKL